MRSGRGIRPYFYRPVLEAKPVTPGDMLELPGLAVRVFTQDHGRVETLGLRIGRFRLFHRCRARWTMPRSRCWPAWIPGSSDCFLRRDAHWTHANLTTVLGWVERLRPRRTVLTHMGNDDGLGLDAGQSAARDRGRAMTGWCWTSADAYARPLPSSDGKPNRRGERTNGCFEKASRQAGREAAHRQGHAAG